MRPYITDEDKEYFSAHCKERYYYLKSRHICVYCGKEEAMINRTYCVTCADRRSERSAEKYSKLSQDQKNKILEKAKERRHELKANGLCYNCGKPAMPDKGRCNECRLKDNRKHAEIRRRKGILPRALMDGNMLCSICGKEQPYSEYKVCKKCYDNLMTNVIAKRKRVENYFTRSMSLFNQKQKKSC